jgi:hypothetical protein
MKSRNEKISGLRFADKKKTHAVNKLLRSFIDSCDYTGVSQLVLSEYKKYIDVTDDRYKKFLQTCISNDHYMLLRRLINVDTNRVIDLHFDNYLLWHSTLTSGKFYSVEIAKYLLELSQYYGPINIHSDGDDVMKEVLWACGNNPKPMQIRIIKFLISLEKTHGLHDWHGNNHELLRRYIECGIYRYCDDIIITDQDILDITEYHVNIGNIGFRGIIYVIMLLAETNRYHCIHTIINNKLDQSTEKMNEFWFYLADTYMSENEPQSRTMDILFRIGLDFTIFGNIIHHRNNQLFRFQPRFRRILIQLSRKMNYCYDWSYLPEYRKYDKEMYDVSLLLYMVQKSFTQKMGECAMFDANVLGITESYVVPGINYRYT